MSAFARAAYLLRSDFGRADGWDLELDGRVIAGLTDPMWADQFWHSYTVIATIPDGEPLMRDDNLWSQCRFVFKNRRTGEIVNRVFCGGSPPFIRSGRILMRGLYLQTDSTLERICLAFLRLLPIRTDA